MRRGAGSPLLLALILLMVLGFAVYYRLWVIHYRASYHDSQLLRRQFDLANKEAMDESAEWRLRFDEEKERATRCMLELTEMKRYHKDTQSMKDKLDMLQKENMDLLERLETLKQELETEKFKCSS